MSKRELRCVAWFLRSEPSDGSLGPGLPKSGNAWVPANLAGAAPTGPLRLVFSGSAAANLEDFGSV